MEKTKNIKEYILSLIFISILFILILSVSYDNLNMKSKTVFIQTEKEEYEINTEIKIVNNDIYLNIEEYNKVLNDNIYLDKVSRKIIYTTDKGLIKESINSNNNVIYEESNIWINLKSIEKNFNKKVYYIKQINTIFFEDATAVKGEILKNNIEMYYSKEKDTVYDFRLGKKDKVYVLNIEENINDSKYIHVIYRRKDKEYLGYILKNNLKYNLEIEKTIIDENKENNKLIGISENGKYSDIEGLDIISIDALKLTSPKGNITIENRDRIISKAKSEKKEVYALINNDFKSSNFDNSIISSMLNSEINRENNIKSILKYLKNKEISGIIINYRRLKNSDKDVYTQYLKELTSVMHLNGFEVIVKSGLESYIDTDNIFNIVDSVIIELYNERTINSNTSGTHFKYSNLVKVIEKYKEKNHENKIIIEIPLYSILWTERNGIVVQAEVYSSKLEKQYIERNNVKLIENTILKQKYFELEKGNIVYKMWLEDEYSIKNKIELIKENELKGISLYKLGYETKEIVEVLKDAY